MRVEENFSIEVISQCYVDFGVNKVKIVYIVNVDWFFISHRLPIALEAINQGHEVFIFAKDTGKMDYLKSLGMNVYPIGLERGSLNPFSSLNLLFDLKRKLSSIQPDVVHLVTIKPVLLGGIASILAKGACNSLCNFRSRLYFYKYNDQSKKFCV